MELRMVLENKEDVVNPLMVAGKNINGVLGIGKINVRYIKRSIVLRPIPELKNRFVRSVACGDFHTLAVVSGYLPHAKLPNLQDQTFFTGSDVFGWGENGCGQIMA